MLKNPQTQTKSAALPKVAPSQQADRDAIRAILQVMAAGGIAGFGLRGLSGLASLEKPQLTSYQSNVPEFRPPNLVNHNNKKPTQKFAGSGMGDHIVEGVRTGLLEPMKKIIPGGGTLGGSSVDQSGSKPYYIPGAIIGGMGALYGGSRLADWFINHRKAQIQDEEVGAAEDAYQKAIQELYAAKTSELAENSNVRQLFAVFEKVAEPDPATVSGPVKDFFTSFRKFDPLGSIRNAYYGNILGPSLLAGGATGIIAHQMAYNNAREKDPRKAMRRAIALRQREAERQLPQPIMLSTPEE